MPHADLDPVRIEMPMSMAFKHCLDRDFEEAAWSPADLRFYHVLFKVNGGSCHQLLGLYLIYTNVRLNYWDTPPVTRILQSPRRSLRVEYRVPEAVRRGRVGDVRCRAQPGG